jgi:hypothetical protein
MNATIPQHHLTVPILSAHAATGSLAWGLLLPLGAVLFALNRYPISSRLHPRFRIFWLHAIIQCLGVTLAIVNFGTGLKIGLKVHKLYHDPHTIIGTVVIALMAFQPLWGVIHHCLVAKHKGTEQEKEDAKIELGSGSGRSSEEKNINTASQSSRADSNAGGDSIVVLDKGKWWGLLHRWIGRTTITLAMINGGLGFRLAYTYRPVWSYEGEVAYSVLVTVVFVVWQGFVFGGFWSRRKEARRLARGSGAEA